MAASAPGRCHQRNRHGSAWSSTAQWDVDVSPFDAHGNLLFGVQDTPRVEDHAGDRKVQAYNYRICLTDAGANRLPIEKPATDESAATSCWPASLPGSPPCSSRPEAS